MVLSDFTPSAIPRTSDSLAGPHSTMTRARVCNRRTALHSPSRPTYDAAIMTLDQSFEPIAANASYGSSKACVAPGPK